MTKKNNEELAQLQEALADARQKLVEQDEVFKRLNETPLIYGTVAWKTSDGRLVVSVSNGLVEVPAPRGKVKAGFTVAIHGETGGILRAFAPDRTAGEVARVVRVVDANTAEVEAGSSTATVVCEAGAVKPGDRVVLDPRRVVVVMNLGQPEVHTAAPEAPVAWDDIGGQDDAKAALVEAIEMPVKFPQQFKRYGQRVSKGVLLYGPPGCGKTMLGKAAMTSLARAHGKEPGAGFIYVKGPEVLNMYVGQSESNVRELFNKARAFKAEAGYPAVIFIDEGDAVLGKRGRDVHAGMSSTVVPSFLTEMDGMQESAAIVMVATNRPDVLDPAVVRDGRVDRKVYVARPTQDLAERIFKIHLAGKPVDGDDLPARAAADLFDKTRGILGVRYDDGAIRDFRLSDVASGAMIAGVVAGAATRAMRRERATGKDDVITATDVTAALDEALENTAKLDHQDDLADFVEMTGGKAVAVEKLRGAQAQA